MIEKRFHWVYIKDNTLELRDNGIVKVFNNERLEELLNELAEENKQYKSLFFELVETALTDKNCRELYCKGILDIFNKANSLNQAREMIKEHLE